MTCKIKFVLHKLQDKMSAVIETNNLVKRYGDVTAVDGLSLRVAPGEIFAFLPSRAFFSFQRSRFSARW
jgi:hypothetical protein